MSWEAVNWANEQRVGSPSAQLVLLLMANWGTPEGRVNLVNVKKLAACSCQSPRSVFRRLKFLEDIGLLTRELSERNPNGSPIVSGQLHLDRSYVREEDDPDGETAEADNPAPDSSGGECQSVTGGECQSVTGVGGGSDTGVTPLSATAVTPHIEIQPNLTNSRESLSQVTAVPSGAKRLSDEERLNDQFAELLHGFGFRPWMDGAACKAEFFGFSAEDREKAVRYAPLYAASAVEDHRRSRKSLLAWLRERDFDVLEASERKRIDAERAAKALADSRRTKKVFVLDGTPQMVAWKAYKQPLRQWPPLWVTTDKGASGAWFDSEWPPGFHATGPPQGQPEIDNDVKFC